MTTNQPHIDAALERLTAHAPYLCEGNEHRAILTDLVEAVTAEESEYEITLANALRDAEAKLAEVRAEAFEARRKHATEVGTYNYYEGQYDLACAILAILDKEAL